MRTDVRLIGDLLLLASTDADAWSVRLESVETDTLALEAYEAHLPLYRKKRRFPQHPSSGENSRPGYGGMRSA
jgi:hypothetical protein